MSIDSLLSTHFSLREMTRTSIRNIDNTPSPEVVVRLTQLCNWLLEPIREQFGALHINSGYRSKEVNARIGAKDSAHLYGCAADFEPVDRAVEFGGIMAWVVASALPYDQVIEEHCLGSDWIHIGILRPSHEAAPRRQALVMRGGLYSRWAR